MDRVLCICLFPSIYLLPSPHCICSVLFLVVGSIISYHHRTITSNLQSSRSIRRSSVRHDSTGSVLDCIWSLINENSCHSSVFIHTYIITPYLIGIRTGQQPTFFPLNRFAWAYLYFIALSLLWFSRSTALFIFFQCIFTFFHTPLTTSCCDFAYIKTAANTCSVVTSQSSPSAFSTTLKHSRIATDVAVFLIAQFTLHNGGKRIPSKDVCLSNSLITCPITGRLKKYST